MQLQKYTPHLALLLTNIIWGMAYPLYHIVLSHKVDPLSILTATMIFSALFSLIPLLWERREKIERRDIFALVCAALLIAVIRKGLLIYSLSLTSPIDGSIISTLAPIIVLLISVIIGIERFNMSKITGLILGLSGAVGVILTSTSAVNQPHMALAGNIMVLCCAIISAIYMVWFKSLLKRYSPNTVMRWMFCTAAIILTPFGWKPMLEVDLSSLPPHILLALIYLILIPTYLPNLMLNYALQYVSPTISGTYIYIQPLVAGVVSMFLHIDTPRLITFGFAGLIFLGVGVVISSYKTST